MQIFFIFGIATVDSGIDSSTLFLTLLLMLGLFFFLRASVKDRTKKIQLSSSESQEILLSRLQEYFESRSYQIVDLDRDKKQVTFQGLVRPSLFMAIFLSLLAQIGCLCLALVLSFLYPQIGNGFLLLIAIAPLTGFLYWQKARRTERVALKVEPADSKLTNVKTLMTIAAHRDELIQMQQTIAFETVEN